MRELFQKLTKPLQYQIRCIWCSILCRPSASLSLPHDEGKNDKALRMSARESSVIKNKVQGLASYSFFGGLISVLYSRLKLVNTTCMHTTGDLSFFFPTFIGCILMLLW